MLPRPKQLQRAGSGPSTPTGMRTGIMTSCDVLHPWWHKQETACGLRHGSVTPFGALFDWPELASWLREAAAGSPSQCGLLLDLRRSAASGAKFPGKSSSSGQAREHQRGPEVLCPLPAVEGSTIDVLAMQADHPNQGLNVLEPQSAFSSKEGVHCRASARPCTDSDEPRNLRSLSKASG